MIVGKKCNILNKIIILSYPCAYTDEKGGIIMNQHINKHIKSGYNENRNRESLKHSNFSYTRERKKVKTALEKSNKGLIALK